jgi:hypothetical protein
MIIGEGEIALKWIEHLMAEDPDFFYKVSGKNIEEISKKIGVPAEDFREFLDVVLTRVRTEQIKGHSGGRH